MAGGSTTSMNPLLRLHRWLLPDDPQIGWTPYLWLFYLVSFYWKWFFVDYHPVEFPLTILSTGVFLALYFNGFWHSGRRLLLNAIGLVALAAVWVPFNAGAMTFFIYGAAFIGMITPPRRALSYLAVLVVFILAQWWLMDLHWAVPVFGAVISAMIGATNIYYAELGRKSAALRLSQAEVRQLAAVAERERIARDLHDLLGHSLSVITIKAELAAKLAEADDPRATQEIREVERISRDSLRQVREAVSGFRRAGLEGEIANARLACEAASVRFTGDVPELELSPEHEAVFAMVLREAITNVIRHAGASLCEMEIERRGDEVVMRIHDDGRGGELSPGSGLNGMRERLEAVGGGLSLEIDRGVTVQAWITADQPSPRGRAEGVPA